MTDPRSRISTHADFDDVRWWRFERDSKIPYGTFDHGVSADWYVVVACVICLIVALWVSV